LISRSASTARYSAGPIETRRDEDREDRRGDEGGAVERVAQQELEIAEADELHRQAERVGDEQRLPDRLPRRIEEEHRRDDAPAARSAQRQPASL
jgi:hypothetical protein